MYYLKTEQSFDSAHFLKDYDGKCRNLHGHCWRVVAEICDKVSVMYAGHIMEQGPVDDIFYRPSHPYTKGLLRSMPNLEDTSHTRLIPIAGTPVDLLDPPKGCSFGPRCEDCMKVCLTNQPPMVEVGEKHLSACWDHVQEMLRQQSEIRKREASDTAQTGEKSGRVQP